MEREPEVEPRSLYDKPVSPLDGMFLALPQFDLVILSFLTFQNPINITDVKSAMAISLSYCPLLRCIPVTTRFGRLRWTELRDIDVNDHIINAENDDDDNDDDERYVNCYVAAMASWPPMRRDRPLWEVHVLPRRRRSLVLRVHHSLGDCVSLLALFLASCDTSGDVQPSFSSPVVKSRGIVRWMRDTGCMMRVLTHFVTSSMYRMEDKTIIAGGFGVERMPRKMVTLALSMDDMVIVKNKLGAKINDVFMGIMSYGVAKYLTLKTPKETIKDPVISVIVMVNIRGHGTKDILDSTKRGGRVKWGNKMVPVSIPVRLVRKASDPLQYVQDVQSSFSKKKKSNEAVNAYRLLSLGNAFGEKLQALLYYKIASFNSLLLSNIVGPINPVALNGNLMTRIGVTTNSLPTALEVHMISYNGKAFLQFHVASEIIPDPELLSSCVEEALCEMKTSSMDPNPKIHNATSSS